MCRSSEEQLEYERELGEALMEHYFREKTSFSRESRPPPPETQDGVGRLKVSVSPAPAD